ncbi:hypothetical protein [Cyanothece sp. BG0011]|uniref:hypothetical protein n=1 Tax=Cyanothece sp. BG0011 TaxID=2082950 RepID=UPI0018E5A3DD|nr:hypothetical protein [Cyanothece sp. BG0011]
MEMLSNTVIEQFIIKLRLHALVEGIDEKAALKYASVKLRLITGEVSEYEYHTLIDDINHIFGMSSTSQTTLGSSFNHWIEREIHEIQTT